MAKSSTFVATLKFVDSFSKGFSKALSNAQAGTSKLNSIARATSNLGASLSNAGRAMTLGITMPIVALGTKAVQSAMDYEGSINKIMTLKRKFASQGTIDLNDSASVDAFEESIKKTILETSNAYAVSQTNLAQSYYLLSSAFNDTTHMQQALNTSTQMSIAGNVDSASSAKLLATIYNAYSKSMGETDETIKKIGDTLAATVNFGFTEFPELAEAMGEVATPAANMGITLDDLATSLAVITSTGLSTAQSVTYFRRAIADATKGGDRQLFTEGKFLSYLESIKKELPEYEQIMTKFKNIRSSSAMVGLTGNTDLFEAYAKEIKNAGGTLDESTKQIQNSAAYNFRQTLIQLENILIRVGERILPTVNKVLERFCGWLDKVELTDEDVDKIIAWGAGLAAAGPALQLIGGGLQVVSGFVGVLGSIAKHWQTICGAVTTIAAKGAGILKFLGAGAETIVTGAAAIGGGLAGGIMAVPAFAYGFAKTEEMLDEQQANGTYDYDVGTRSKTYGTRVQGASNAVKVGTNATGSSRWRGGLTTINERGGEIVDLPTGSRIYPHDQSMKMGGLTINIPKFADTITIRNENDIDRFADAFANKLLRVVVNR